MTLIFVDSREAVMVEAVDSDPVRALMGARRDGLLGYHGVAAGGRYEVEIAGRPSMLQAREVVDTVERLRALERVTAVGVPASLVQVRRDGTFLVEVGGRSAKIPGDGVVDWCSGWLAAHAAQLQDHAGQDMLEEIAEVFDRPSHHDQYRMVILGLTRQPGNMIGAEKLAEMIGKLPGVERAPVKKTVVDALRFGNYLRPELAEQMIDALGYSWAVGAVRADGGVLTRADLPAPVGVLPEMPGLLALRRILEASRAGWLHYVDEPSLNEARWKPERGKLYQLTVGERGYSVYADRLGAWLDGVAAFHAG